MCVLSVYAVGVCCVFCHIVFLVFIAGVCSVSRGEDGAGWVGDIS